VDNHLAARTLMRGIPFAVLMIAEFGVAVVVFGKSVPEQRAAYGSVPGIIGLAGQVCFAPLSVLQNHRS